MIPQTALIPKIESDRLILRGHQAGDLEALLQLWSDPDVTRHIGGRPFTREECWARIQRYVGHWALLGFGFWAVQRKSDGAFLGDLGFADFQRDMSPGFDGAPEAGWALAPAFHGQGYAYEALNAALVWAQAHLNADRVACMIDPGNLRSIRLAEKLGFRRYADANYRGSPTLLFQAPL